MWIRIYFLRIRIQLFFSMQIRIQLISWTKCVKNYLIKGWKRLKIVQKLKTTVWSCSIFTEPHLKKNIKNTTVLISFLPFFLFSPQYFPLWIQIRIRILNTDPGTGGKITAEPNPQSCRPAAGNMLHNHNFLGRNNFPVYSIVLSFFMILLRLGWLVLNSRPSDYEKSVLTSRPERCAVSHNSRSHRGIT